VEKECSYVCKLFHIIKFCSLFCIFLTNQSEVDFRIEYVAILIYI
jgi:hypothetical protein